MGSTSAFSRALCLLLVLVAMLPATLRQGGSACGADALAVAGAAASSASSEADDSCCCGPAAPAATAAPGCGGAAGATLRPADCGCSAEAPPATPVQGAPQITISDHAHETALPPRHVESLLAVRPAAVTPESGAIRSDHAVSLLRLHCVNQI